MMIDVSHPVERSEPMDTSTPLYYQVTSELGIVPEHTYARATQLAAFSYGMKATRPTSTTSTPKVGQKPITNKRKIKR
jgi:hypothetical protein